MICRKCKTAVEENSKVCQSCGAKLGNNKIIWLFAVAGIIIALNATYALRDSTAEVPKGPEPENPVESPSPLPDGPALEEPVDAPVSKDDIPESQADLDMPIDEVWAMIDDMVDVANQYYDRYIETVAFISKNGYLYDYPSKSYVFSKDFLGVTSMDEKYVDSNVLFFFIRPADLKGYGDLYVSDSRELKIFAGYETKDGFALSATGESGGIISRQDFKKVLDTYLWEKGEVSVLDINSDEYQGVIEAIHLHENTSEPYDVRFLRADTKYVSVVVSPVGEPNKMKQYVLENTGDIFKVVVDGIENEIDEKIYINSIVPDYNMNLLPNYNLSVSFKYLKGGFDNVISVMETNGLISGDDLPAVFQCGTDEFVYMEFTSGKKYVGYFEANTWQMCAIADYYEAYWLMESLSSRPPLYILKQY